MSQAAESRTVGGAPARRHLLMRILLGSLAALLVLLGWLGWEAYHVYSGVTAITGQTQPRLRGEPGYGSPKPGNSHRTYTLPPINGNQRFNVLVLGSDNDAKAEEKKPLTQSMIVLTIDPRTYSVGMLSIPRDFWVPIAGHGYAKIDLAAKYGGISLARATVEKLFGIHIDYYAWVGLSGFQKVIDTFNGITVDVQHPILDDFYPNDQTAGDPYAYQRIFIPAGWRHLSGRQALQYVRSRHADANGDFGRSYRQQQLLLALRKKLTALNVLTNLPGLVDDLQGSVKTDFTITQLQQLYNLSRHIQTSQIKRVVLQAPTYCTYGTATNSIGLQDVLFPRWKAIRPVVHSLFYPPKPKAAPPVRATVAPARHGAPAARHSAAPIPTATAASLSRYPGSLVFEREGNIFALRPDGSVVQLYNMNAAAMPAVSPNGRYIAFVRFSHANESDIWMLDTKTGKTRILTSDSSQDVHNNLWAAFPAFSPDGKELFLSSDRAKLSTPESESRAIDLGIWAYPTAGGAWTQYTIPAVGTGGDTDATPIPGTNRFVYVHWAYDSNSQPYAQLIARDTLDANAWNLTPASGRAIQPAVSRSGRLLTWIQAGDTASNLMVAPLVETASGPHLGRARVLVTGEIAQPDVSPDGQWVSYLQADGNGFDLYLVPVAGGSPTRVSAVGSDMDAISRPVWSTATYRNVH